MNGNPISRRSVMAIGGASLMAAPAAIARPRARSAKANAQDPCNVLSTKGLNLPWGDDPNDLTKEPKTGYEPQYATLVWIDSDGDWNISANYAVLPKDGVTGGLAVSDLSQAAVSAFELLSKNAKKDRKFAQIEKDLKHSFYPRKKGKYAGTKDVPDFDEFGFASQHDIFIYFASDKVALLDKPDHRPGAPSNARMPHLISFSPFDAKGSPVCQNKSFYCNEVIAKGSLKGPLIHVRNHYLTPSGGPMAKGDNFLYAMNIHFALSTGNYDPTHTNKLSLPMVLDPTTGNGDGWEPLY